MRCEREIVGEDAMVALGERLGRGLGAPLVVYLRGELGAGKTTLARGILRGRDFAGAVKSPTYTLVEPYDFADITIYHFDLYRLGEPEELEFMGIRDYFNGQSVALVEWPERGVGSLPAPDLDIAIAVTGPARIVTFEACTKAGVECLHRVGITPEVE